MKILYLSLTLIVLAGIPFELSGAGKEVLASVSRHSEAEKPRYHEPIGRTRMTEDQAVAFKKALDTAMYFRGAAHEFYKFIKSITPPSKNTIFQRPFFNSASDPRTFPTQQVIHSRLNAAQHRSVCNSSPPILTPAPELRHLLGCPRPNSTSHKYSTQTQRHNRITGQVKGLMGPFNPRVQTTVDHGYQPPYAVSNSENTVGKSKPSRKLNYRNQPPYQRRSPPPYPGNPASHYTSYSHSER